MAHSQGAQRRRGGPPDPRGFLEMSSSHNRGIAVALLAAILSLVAVSAPRPGPADEVRPLLMEGKKTLYQRVITRPAAQLHHSSPEGPGQPVPPFTIYYVYDHETIGGKDWIEVGPATQPPVAGWIESD